MTINNPVGCRPHIPTYIRARQHNKLNLLGSPPNLPRRHHR